MKLETLALPETILLASLKVVSVDRLPSQTQDELTNIYFQAWNSQGLCPSLAAAQKTLNHLDSSQAFAAIDDHGIPYALVHTLPVNVKNILELASLLPTYQSVMDLSHLAIHPSNPTFRVCFSIVSRPGYKVLDPITSKPISLSRFLLDHLPKEPSTYKLAYSRTPAVGMHSHYGALEVATLFNSRPEDKATNGTNTLMLYPRNPKEAQHFKTHLHPSTTKLPHARINLDI